MYLDERTVAILVIDQIKKAQRPKSIFHSLGALSPQTILDSEIPIIAGEKRRPLFRDLDEQFAGTSATTQNEYTRQCLVAPIDISSPTISRDARFRLVHYCTNNIVNLYAQFRAETGLKADLVKLNIANFFRLVSRGMVRLDVLMTEAVHPDFKEMPPYLAVFEFVDEVYINDYIREVVIFTEFADLDGSDETLTKRYSSIAHACKKRGYTKALKLLLRCLPEKESNTNEYPKV